jgi:sortase (surface protein transpeptidase)
MNWTAKAKLGASAAAMALGVVVALGVTACGGGALTGAKVLPTVSPAVTSPATAAVSSALEPIMSIPPASDASDAPASSVSSVSIVDAAPIGRSVPVRVEVPSIGVDSTLMGLGLTANGSLQVPPSGFPAGWYTGAPTPGELGPAIIVGHVDWAGKAGVFYRLRSIKPGAQITVVRADGSTAVFMVSSVAEYVKGAFPTDKVYGNTTNAALRLITCGGVFNPKVHSYEDDIVAYAELVSSALA